MPSLSARDKILESLKSMPDESESEGSSGSDSETEEAKKLRDEEKEKKMLAEAVACLQKENRKWHISVTEIGRGSLGRIYAVCDVKETKDSECKKIVKIILGSNKEMVNKEVAVMMLLNHSNISPHLYEAFHCDGHSFLILQRFDTTPEKQAELLYQELKATIDAANTTGTEFAEAVYKEAILIKMFEIAKELGARFKIIHGDLKPDQYLMNLLILHMVLSDYGHAGTIDRKIPATRGWSYLAECGNFQPLPTDDEDITQDMFEKWFNPYQLWSYFAFNSKPTLILRNDGVTLSYISPSSQDYPFPRGHPLFIPPNVIDFFKGIENAGFPDKPKCDGVEITAPDYRMPRSIRPFRV